MKVWRTLLRDYHDNVICKFLEFGWPLGYLLPTLPVFDLRTHRGALNFPVAVADYLHGEMLLGRVAGPFAEPPKMPLSFLPLTPCRSAALPSGA